MPASPIVLKKLSSRPVFESNQHKSSARQPSKHYGLLTSGKWKH